MKTTSTHRQAGRHRLPLDGGGQRGHAAGCLSFSDHSDDPGGQCPAAHRHPALHRRIRPRGPGPGPRQDHPHHHRLPAGRQRGVPYKGTDPMVADLLGGHVAVGVNPVADVADHHSAGKLKVLAVGGAQRSPLLPQVPTLAELGHKIAGGGVERYGFFLPKGRRPPSSRPTRRRSRPSWRCRRSRPSSRHAAVRPMSSRPRNSPPRSGARARSGAAWWPRRAPRSKADPANARSCPTRRQPGVAWLGRRRPHQPGAAPGAGPPWRARRHPIARAARRMNQHQRKPR
jgi:hypothetical protein